jgi:hypothetical protein
VTVEDYADLRSLISELPSSDHRFLAMCAAMQGLLAAKAYLDFSAAQVAMLAREHADALMNVDNRPVEAPEVARGED